ncbi:MAG: NAD-dependent epimerase/dehydratase family protein [Alphaproteobacteria bacterium]|nr:NAD-dependent epimerase/dehydratase family protein [Alphaproteobacteria bacterium]
MTISLVTGGGGFIGQALVDQLVASGERVRILDLKPPATRRANVDLVQGSITDPKLVKEAMAGVRHVYHAAAIAHLWIADPAKFEEINVGGTRIVLEEAVKAKVERVVHTSSAIVLVDDTIGRMPTTRDERHQAREGGLAGHYARSKWRAEKLALSYADKLPVVVVMPTLPLGPGDRHLTPPSRMLLDFVNGRNRAYADCILNIIDVRDVAAGHRLACARGRPGQRYILNRHSISMVSFLECLERLTHRPMPKWRVPGSAALAASAVMELWSNLASGRAPIAPLAGVRMGLRPVIFDSRLADSELGLPATPLDRTLGDAIAWLVGEGRLMGEQDEKPRALDD